MPVWGGLNKEEIRDLQVLQNKAAQIITHMPVRGASRNEIFDMVNWMTVQQPIEYHTLVSIFKIKTRQEKEYLFNILSNENIRGNINILPNQLKFTYKSSCFRGVESYNKLPIEIKLSETEVIFKRKLKIWIMLNVRRFLDD